MKLFGITTGLVLLFTVGMAQATLVTIGTATYSGSNYNLIWDDDNNGNSVVWLDYTNAYTSWSSQNTWVASLGGTTLSYNIGAAYSVSWNDDWRMPNVVGGAYVPGYEGDPDDDGFYNYTTGYNLANSEIGHLFYEELGNLGFRDTDGNVQSGYGLLNTGDFVNLTAFDYWSDPATDTNGWYFCMDTGGQGPMFHGSNGLVLRTGQITTAPVPEPATILLLGGGLAGLAFYRRKKK